MTVCYHATHIFCESLGRNLTSARERASLPVCQPVNWEFDVKTTHILLLVLISPAVAIAVLALALWLQSVGGEPFILRLVVTIIGLILGLVAVTLVTLRTGLEELSKSAIRISSALSIKFKTDSDRSKFLRYPRQELKTGDMSKTWIELLWQFKDTFSATNYIDPAFFANPYADHGLAVQATKVSVHERTIKKILIYDTDAELNSLQPTLQGQHEAGLKVKHLRRKKIEENSELAAMLADLGGNIDFGLFDSDIVLVWYLNPDRSVKGGAILFGEEQFMPYYNFFEALFAVATWWLPP
jgi:hypothetical protein